MLQTTIFGPMLALVGWTLGVLCLVAYRRFKAAFESRVKAGDFDVGESSTVPSDVRIVNRAFMNLTEVPVLFYAVCLISYLTSNATAAVVALAWTYVGLRVAHSLVYLTYNRLMHRFAVFAASNAVLIVLWTVLAFRLSAP